MPRWHAALAALGLALVGCDTTELVLIARSDLPGERVGLVDVVVSSPSRALQHRCVCLEPGCAGIGDVTARWPLTAGLRPARGDDGEVVVELRGLPPGDCAGAPVVSQRARTRFVPHARRALHMSLTARCLDVSCASEEETCRDGACVPVDFPTDPFDGVPPPLDDLGQGDLAAASDLGSASPAPQSVGSGVNGALGQPVIAGGPDAYFIAWLTSGNIVETRAIAVLSPSMVAGASGPSGALKLGVRPGTTFDNGWFLVGALTDNEAIYAAYPGQGTITPSWISLPGGPYTQIALASDGLGVGVGVSQLDSVLRYRLARSMAPGTYVLGPPQVTNLTTATVPLGLAAAASSGRMGLGVIAAGTTFAILPGGATTAYTQASPARAFANASMALAMPVGSSRVLAAAIEASSEIIWTEADVANTPGPTLSFAAVSPPVTGALTEVVVAADGTDLVLAYVRGGGIDERVCTRSFPGTLSCGAPRVVSSASGVSISGLAFAPGPSPGGGRYVWRERGPTADVIITARRSATIP